MCEPNDFYLRVFMFWFDRESIIPGNFGFARYQHQIIPVSVCRLREMGRMSKSVYVRVFHDLELLRYVLRCAIKRQLQFPAGMNKEYIIIVIVLYCKLLCVHRDHKDYYISMPTSTFTQILSSETASVSCYAF